jgi:hypothetical protein
MSLDTDIDLPEWPEILRACQEQLAARIHTSLPAIVKSYNSADQTATVQLAVQLQGAAVPPLADVPVMTPGNLHRPLAAGDSVTVLFSEEDFTLWWTSGSVSAPAALMRHGLHAIAIPGLNRSPLTVTGGHTTLIADELRLGSDSAANFVALANLVDARISAIVTALNGHTHTVATTGTAAAQTGTAAANPSAISAQASVAATKVKAV